jgi:hypothetical protein
MWQATSWQHVAAQALRYPLHMERHQTLQGMFRVFRESHDDWDYMLTCTDQRGSYPALATDAISTVQEDKTVLPVNPHPCWSRVQNRGAGCFR